MKKFDLAKYQRKVPSFKNELNVVATQVIEAMDNAGDDIPYQQAEFQIELPTVGIHRKNVPIQIVNPLAPEQTSLLYGDLLAMTHVPATKRGIHTSRIGQLIAEMTTHVYQNLQEYVSNLAQSLSDVEYGISSKVSVSTTLSYLEEVVGWKVEKNKTSLEHLGLSATASIHGQQRIETAGISLNHITACPCVQQTYKHALLQAKGDIHTALKTVSPLLTHSQRCHTHIEVKDLHQPLPIQSILETLDHVLYRVQNTLPREYELLLVYRAHRTPQFIEDAVRQILANLYSLLKTDFADSTLYIHANSMESIHDFDIVSEIEISMKQLGNMLETPL